MVGAVFCMGGGRFFSTDKIDLLLIRACCRGVAVVCAVSKGSKYWEMGVAIVCGCRGGRDGCV